jgi:hypothetical protein
MTTLRANHTQSALTPSWSYRRRGSRADSGIPPPAALTAAPLTHSRSTPLSQDGEPGGGEGLATTARLRSALLSGQLMAHESQPWADG